MKVSVKVKPNAKADEVKMIDAGNFEVKVKAPPVNGKANKSVTSLLAKHYHLPKTRVRLIKGTSSRQKIFEIEGL